MVAYIPNSYVYGSMGPYAWTSTYGGNYQFNLLPMNTSYWSAMMFQGALNPNHVSQWNPLFSIPMEENVTDPRLVQQGVDIATNIISRNINIRLNQNNVGAVSQMLSSLDSRLDSLLTMENLSQENKDALLAFKESLNDLRERFNAVKEEMNKPDSDVKAIGEELTGIKSEMQTLAKNILEVAKEISDTLQKQDSTDPKTKD